MSLSKEKARNLLAVAFSIFLIVQSIGLRYGRAYRSQQEMVGMHELSQLQNIWRKAAVEDLITLKKLADPTELQQARTRLEEAEKGIQNSEKQALEVSGKKPEFLQKTYAYYRHSASALIAIIKFLLAKKEEYSVNGNEINFESEADAEKFRELISQFGFLYQEKQGVDALILNYSKAL